MLGVTVIVKIKKKSLMKVITKKKGKMILKITTKKKKLPTEGKG